MIIAIYFHDVPEAGYQHDTTYFSSEEKGAAISALDLPVYIMTDASSTSSTKNAISPDKPNSTIRIPSTQSCEREYELCNKISFARSFSKSDIRKYQSLIIKQINDIDAILDNAVKIKDMLYSITLHKDK